MLAIGAALLFGVGSVVQQHAAAQAPPQDVMSIKLLLWLVRRRLWLVGVATALVGNLLSADALGRGSIALVEPLLVLRLLFALPLAAAWHRCRVPGRDWLAAGATAAGLAGFVVAGHPSQLTSVHASNGTWTLAGGAVVGLAAVLAIAGRRLDALRRAPMLAAGAGLLFALQAALTSTTVRMIGHPARLLSSWYVYAVLAVALTGTLFVQSAYELAPLQASFPAQVTVEPLAGLLLGVVVLHGSIRVAPISLAGEVAGLLVMIAGVFALATSPLVTGQLSRIRLRQEQGNAYRAERELAHALDGLQKDLERWQASAEPVYRHAGHRRRLRAELRTLEGELERLSTALAGLDRWHDATHDVRGNVVGADVAVDEEAQLRTQGEALRGRAGSLCARAEALLTPAGGPRAESPG